MFFLDCTLPTLAENLALDEALLLEAEAGGPEVLRFWEWPAPAVILGAGGQWAQEVHEEACRNNHVPILRRSSGGGTVLLGQGCLLFSLVLSFQRHLALGELHPSYRHILGKLCAALDDLAPGIALAGISDLAVGGRKVSGNSQQRKRTHLLHHGTLLYDFTLDLVPRYLQEPPRQPDYRRQRIHGDFVMNLGATRAELTHRLRAAWDADEELGQLPLEKVRELVAEKYRKEEWNFRR